MKYGKYICQTLKEIRSEIAAANEIDYSPTECHHEGDCAGTCPKCESETRWLEKQLRSRQAMGKVITIAGLSVALGSMSSCTWLSNQKQGSVPDKQGKDSSYCSPVDSSQSKITTTDNIDTTAQSNRITPLGKDGKEVAPLKNNQDNGEEILMGEVAVDENGNEGTL